MDPIVKQGFLLPVEISQTFSGSTTMGERRINAEFPYSPLVVIICPKPGFKSSFFDEKNIPRVYKDFIWKENDFVLERFQNDVLSAYINMTYKFGIDWKAYVVNFGWDI